jgi:uncharacterized ferritin-like protein (DUF455 family)
MELRQRALQALCTPDPASKVAQALALGAEADGLPVGRNAPAMPGPLPGRPPRPVLIHPARVPRRSPFRPEGLAALLHAICHIEFNAINLALDCAWRFDGMPAQFHRDWVRVAAEEAHHFTLLSDLLGVMGWGYGDFDAHDGLWSMCEKTAADIVARMALVPRTLEARGLDATPQIQDKLRRVPSIHATRAVAILDVILRDEIGHVAVGNHWYRVLCAERQLDPLTQYAALVRQYAAPRLHPPFNVSARRLAGFTAVELELLEFGPGT